MKFNTPFLRLWGMPIILGTTSIIGLITALIGDGIWDVASWLLLGWLLFVMVYFWIKRPKASS